jgi:hypothetical protein
MTTGDRRQRRQNMATTLGVTATGGTRRQRRQASGGFGLPAASSESRAKDSAAAATGAPKEGRNALVLCLFRGKSNTFLTF